MRDDANCGDGNDLSVAEMILRDQDLWDEISRSSDCPDPTPAQLMEIERRLRRHELSPGKYTTWEELRDRLLRRP